jgi:CBS domain-containing protein
MTSEEQKIGVKAKDIMTTDIILLKEDYSLHKASRALSDYHTSGAPIVNDIGKIVGILSESDIVSYISTFQDDDLEFDKTSALPELAQMYIQASAKPVADIMTTEVVTAKPETSIEDLARLMTENNINRVPIIEKGKLVGIVSRIDILKNIGKVYLEKI